MKKFNFKLVNGKMLNAELIEDKICFEMAGSYRAKHLIALRSLYNSSGGDFILDARADMVIPNRSFIVLLDELEDEIGYIHTRKTVDVVSEERVIDSRKN